MQLGPMRPYKGDPFPNATTICRFRNRLVAVKFDQVLLKRINAQLERQGFKVSGVYAAPSSTRRSFPARLDQVSTLRCPTMMTMATPKRSTELTLRHAGPRKGQQGHYGYHGYAAVDGEDGFVEHVEMHPANASEVKKLTGLLDELPPRAERSLSTRADYYASSLTVTGKFGRADSIAAVGALVHSAL